MSPLTWVLYKEYYYTGSEDFVKTIVCKLSSFANDFILYLFTYSGVGTYIQSAQSHSQQSNQNDDQRAKGKYSVHQ